ncbi:MAG: A/G-specific adenine glycosylase [Clostridia bacterium]
MNSEFVEPLIHWYRAQARDLPWRRNKQGYAVWISEIMLQQTRVSTVIPYYIRFLEELPNVAALSRVDDERLQKLWEGLGYYSRARNLKRAASDVMMRFDGQLPLRYEELMTLPGIGEYTAGAVASIAGGVRVPAVDGNVLRVMARLLNDSRDIANPKTKQAVRSALLPILPDDAGTFNSALMELGAMICVPNGAPHCETCPVQACCGAYLMGTVGQLPVKSSKKARRMVEKTVFALSAQGQYIGSKRAETGLLAGLWQLPEVDGILSDEAIAGQLSIWGVRPTGDLLIYARKHIFTHIEWHMRVCAAEVETDLSHWPEGWIMLEERMALPTAYRVCLPR